MAHNATSNTSQDSRPDSVDEASLERKTSFQTSERVYTPIVSELGAEQEVVGYLTGLKLYVLVGAMGFVVFMVMLNASILSNAIPKITSEFHSLGEADWYANAYFVVNCTILPLTGKIFDHFPLKTSYLAFIWIYALGSIVAGAAQSSNMLIAGRCISGLGGAGVLGGTMAIINAAAPLQHRAKFQGPLMGFIGVGTAAGPVLSGVITQKASWRWCFYINPIVIVPLSVAVALIPFPGRASDAHFSVKSALWSLDLSGFAIFAPALVMFLLALHFGGTDLSWNSSVVIGLFCGSIATFSLFFIWEHHAGDKAMVPLSLITRRRVIFAFATIGLNMGGLTQLVYYLPLWFQGVKGDSPIMSGVSMLALAISQMILSTLSGILLSKTGYYLPWAFLGGIATSIGSGLICTFTATTSTGKWVGYEILMGAGRGFVQQMCIVAVQKDAPKRFENIGSTLAIFTQLLTGSIFIAIAQAIFNDSLGTALRHFAPQVSKDQILSLGAQGLRILPRDLIAGVISAYNNSLVDSFYLIAAGSAAGTLTCLGMGWRSIKSKNDGSKEIELQTGSQNEGVSARQEMQSPEFT